MAFSYSCIVNYGKATLPSTESALGSMYIVKDPPKSITTRRVDKVSDTCSITEMVDESNDRFNEAISYYARGVNPSVSVSYGNEGNNGGQNSSSIVGHGGGYAYLPYRILDKGAFRPPVMTSEQLMPLSRQARENTTAFSQKGFTDFSKTLLCDNTDTCRSVKKEMIKVCVRPTATYRLDAPLIEPFEIKYVIKNPVKFDQQAGISGQRTRDLTTQDVIEPLKEIDNNPLHVNARSNIGSSATIKYTDDISSVDTDRYTQNILQGSIYSNPSQSIQSTPIEDVIDVDIHVKDPINISYTATKSGNTKDEYVHSDIELDRRVVQATAITNKQRNIHHRPPVEHQEHEQKRNLPLTNAVTNNGTSLTRRQTLEDLNSREYKLAPKVSPGGFSGKGGMPMLERMQQIIELKDSDRVKMSKKIMDMQFARKNY